MYKFDCKQFKAELDKRGLSFGRFAEELRHYGRKIGKQHIYRWANGISQPSLNHYFIVIQALDKEPKSLIKSTFKRQ